MFFELLNVVMGKLRIILYYITTITITLSGYNIISLFQ